MSYAIGLAEMDTTIAIILGMISTGCVIAALGELKFSMFGFVCQVLAVVVSWMCRGMAMQQAMLGADDLDKRCLSTM